MIIRVMQNNVTFTMMQIIRTGAKSSLNDRLLFPRGKLLMVRTLWIRAVSGMNSAGPMYEPLEPMRADMLSD